MWRDKACLLRGNGNGCKRSVSKHCDSGKLWAWAPLSIFRSSVIVWQRGAWEAKCWVFHLSSRSMLCSFQPALVSQAGHSELHWWAAWLLAPGWSQHWEALAGDWREADHEGSLFIPPGWPLSLLPSWKQQSLLGDLLLWLQQLSWGSLLLPFAPSGWVHFTFPGCLP